MASKENDRIGVRVRVRFRVQVRLGLAGGVRYRGFGRAGYEHLEQCHGVATQLAASSVLLVVLPSGAGHTAAGHMGSRAPSQRQGSGPPCIAHLR